MFYCYCWSPSPGSEIRPGIPVCLSVAVITVLVMVVVRLSPQVKGEDSSYNLCSCGPVNSDQVARKGYREYIFPNPDVEDYHRTTMKEWDMCPKGSRRAGYVVVNVESENT